MQILQDLIKIPNLSLALGYFDGIHLGHQKVIKSAVDYARKLNTKSAVITFDNHPCCYIWGVCPKYILTDSLREKKLRELGVDYVFKLDFKSISNLSANDYLKKVLIDYFSPVSISVGWNHNFGSNKSGNCRLLRDNAQIYGYKFFEIQPEKFENKIISSTEIRQFLSTGDIKNANNMLGYDFLIKGEVVKGEQLGRKIGFRTANINYPSELIEIPYGAYETETVYENISYKSVSNFGTRPTVNGTKTILEVHILDFDKDIYGQNLMVKFKRMLRKEQKFESIEDLKNQISNDINLVKNGKF